MCVIAISPAGCRHPSEKDFRLMWNHNPHGAGIMWCEHNKVYIQKGLMTFDDFMDYIRYFRFTPDDPVVYHFRISTQAGTGPEMTHPFPLTSNPYELRKLSPEPCDIGIAHNGIIRLTSDPLETTFSDTALFIQKYLTKIIRSPADLESEEITAMIETLAQSKLAFLRNDGQIFTIGKFYKQPGKFLVSNEFYKPVRNFSGWSYNYFNNLHVEV